jgi:DNA primase
MFPILDARGNVIGFGGRVIGEGEPKYLNSPETPLFEKGRELYGLYQARRSIRDANQVFVVEGYMDVVALAQHGVANAVATLGTATTPVHVGKLLKLADNVVFCFDGDAAGRKAAWRALEVSLPVLADGKVVSFLFLPTEDDPDTYVRREGKEGFERAAAAAKPLSQFLFAELAGQVDMTSDEGRARFVSQARPLVAQVEAPALAAMLRRRLAELARLAPEEVERLLPSQAPAPRGRPAPTRSTRQAARTPEWNLLGRVVNRPDLASLIPDDALRGVGPDAETLRAVVAFARANPGAHKGQVSAYFEGSEHQDRVASASAEPLLDQSDSPDFDFASEVGALVDTLRNETLNRRRSELTLLVEARTATPEQEAEYRQLLERLATAKAGTSPAEAQPKA